MSDSDSSDDQNFDSQPVSSDEEESKDDLSKAQPESLNAMGFCEWFLERANRPIFEDVTPMVNSTIPFLIDCDTLMLYALQQNSHDIRLGNQFLHVVYTCERILDILLQKGATFVLIFVNIWELAWNKNTSLLALRKVIHEHFRHNTKFRIRQFPGYFSTEFKKFICDEKPRCILTDINIDLNVLSFNNRLKSRDESLDKSKLFINFINTVKIFTGQLVVALSNDLPVIDLRNLTPSVSIIKSFHLKSFLIPKDIIGISSGLIKSFETPSVSIVFNGVDVARWTILETAKKFLLRNGEKNHLKLILLSYAAKSVLPIGNRATPKLLFSSKLLDLIQMAMLTWQECLNSVLCNFYYNKNVYDDKDFRGICDLWQGTLFATIIYKVSEIIEERNGLGNFQSEYESYVGQLNEGLSGSDIIEAYPISPFVENVAEIVTLVDIDNARSQELVPLQKIDNLLIEAICGDVFDQVLWRDPSNFSHKEKFEEARHWHSRKPITQEYHQISDSTVKALQTKYEHRGHLKAAKYLNYYGENLEGGSSCYEPIVYEDPRRRKRASGQNKQTQKSKTLQKKIIDEKERNALEKETKGLDALQKRIKNAKFGEDPKIFLNEVDTICLKMTHPETKLRATITKLKILGKSAKDNNCLSIVKEVFATIRAVLLKDRERLSEEDSTFLSTLLRQFGFKEIADKNDLPADAKFKEVSSFNWIRFQLEHLSSDLLQEVGHKFDPDVNFAPDPWQSEFIDAIRKNESALVVAPTSSGKTFACYYCMKRVLQHTEDGIVVYVSPTKALVNQVAATVTHRFKKTTLPDGVALVGVFTRDWRQNTLNSRILITVPQCLDILLMSPEQYKWTKRVRYVIFDEVHKLSGNEEGLVWERLLLMIKCPFLALSATISEPNYFHEWLQSIEHAKREKDILNNFRRDSYNVRFVVHTARHADLTKYVYQSNQFHHYHPYASLHGVVLKDNQGIPESVTLSPRETLQLYDVLCEYVQAKALLGTEMLLDEYFNCQTKNGFITRNSVTQYAKSLGNVFYTLFLEYEDVYEIILARFNLKNDDDQEGIRLEMLMNGKALLNHMADKNMLPAIVFSYNRSVVEELHKLMVESTMNKINKEEEKQSQKTGGKRNSRIASAEVQDDTAMSRKNSSKTSSGLSRATSKFNDNRDGNSSRPALQNPLDILRDVNSKFKGIGVADSGDMQYIEERIYWKFHKRGTRPVNYNTVISGFQLGLAYHHAGVNKLFRDTTEMLFRMGIAKVVIATGSLALGIHMPCKSVVVFGDSPFLNSLEYHQMSGRAGRRGFDNEGNVIFANLTKKRRDMLMTDRLPKMLGNYPINVTLVAKLLLLVTNVHDGGKKTKESLNLTVDRVLVMLENSLVFKSKPYLKLQIKQFIGFAIQLLLMQRIIDHTGAPLMLTVFVHHLHYHEPSNLIFSYLIKHGVIRKLLSSIPDDVEAQYTLMVVLTHLFSHVPLNKRLLMKDFCNSIVVLEPLPEIIVDALKDYNNEVNFVFNEYFISIAKLMMKEQGNVPEKLPLSNVEFPWQNDNEITETPGSLSQKLKSICVPRLVISPFIALSSTNDDQLDIEQLINNIRYEISPEVNIVPTFSFNRKLNAYPLDFYRHGIVKAISKDNGLKLGEEYALLHDFFLVLKTIVLGLEDLEAMDENDIVLKHTTAVKEQYCNLFSAAFMR